MPACGSQRSLACSQHSVRRWCLPSWPLHLVSFVVTAFPGLNRVTASVQAGPVGCALSWPGAQFHPASRSPPPLPCPSSEHIWFLTDSHQHIQTFSVPHTLQGSLELPGLFVSGCQGGVVRDLRCLQEPGRVQSSPLYSGTQAAPLSPLTPGKAVLDGMGQLALLASLQHSASPHPLTAWVTTEPPQRGVQMLLVLSRQCVGHRIV